MLKRLNTNVFLDDFPTTPCKLESCYFYVPVKARPSGVPRYKTFWQRCITEMASALFFSPSLSTYGRRPVTWHPWGGSLRKAEACLVLGPKPDNLTVIHSKLIKHLQMCHAGRRALLFIRVLHHQHAQANLAALAASQSTYANEMAARGRAGAWQPDLCTEIISKYSSIMGGGVCLEKRVEMRPR